MLYRSGCISMTSVFKSSKRKGHFWSYVGVKNIVKRLFNHQNKEKTKQFETKMIMLRERGLHILQI